MSWQYGNLLSLEIEFRDEARVLLQSRIPSYPSLHCAKLLGGSPHQYSSRCVLEPETNKLLGVMAFSVCELKTVEIVAFVSNIDGKGIGRFLMQNFVTEMQQNGQCAILTYVEPSALEFFTRMGFTTRVPARSLYERVVSKYVKATLMYCDLCVTTNHHTPPAVSIGDKLMVLVDGTMTPRQCIVKDFSNGLLFVHYIYWSSRNDEWIHPNSPRILWGVETPPVLQGLNRVTANELKALNVQAFEKQKKLDLVKLTNCWLRGIKKNAKVNVRVDGMWIPAIVVEKGDLFCYCEFEHGGQKWLQDFPRESIKLSDSDKSVLDTLLAKKQLKKPKNAPVNIIAKNPLAGKVHTSKVPTGKLHSRDVPTGKVHKGTPNTGKLAKKKTQIVLLPIEISPHRRAVRARREQEELPSAPPMPYIQYECSVCMQTNPPSVLHCKQCGLNAHAECYMQAPPRNPNSWQCDTCKECCIRGSMKFNPACVACGKTRTETMSVMAQCLDYRYIHVKCAREANLEFVASERRFFKFKKIT